MKKSQIRFTFALIPALLTTAYVSGTSAFTLETHETVNIRAAGISALDTYLREELALMTGLGQSFTRRSGEKWRVDDWIRLGGRAEDLYDENQWFGAAYRSKNHFHNPIVASWADSGLRTRSLCPPFVISGEASPRWAQDPAQGQSGQASWADARRFYLDALTRSSEADRDDAWSRTFQILGQQMHLIADLAVPAHTRNDIHCPASDRFELWAMKNSSKVDAVLNAPVQPADPGILSINVPVDDQVAKVPIARLMDTDQYDGTNPTDTMRFAVGVAEYTNANFFSDHTVFDDHRFGDPSFRYPSSSSVVLGAEEDAPGGVRRRYFLKTQDGDTGYRLAVPSALYESLPDALRDQEKALDDKVLEDYATRLLPKAVTYSAALLDYFFRGKLEATIVADPADQQGLQLIGKNASEEALKDGTLKVYGDYATDGRRELGSWAIAGSVLPGADLPGQPFKFSPPIDRPVPKRYMVVYQGNLGEEKKDNPPGFGGAVIGKAAGYGGVIEELILFRTDQNTYDVYFRNSNQASLLNLSERLPVAPYSRLAEVHWGVDSNHFFVKNYEYTTYAGTPIHVPIYHIYRIVRPENEISGGDPITTEFVKTIRPRETPLPYRSHTVYVNRPQYNSDGQMVYPYGMVFSPPYRWVQAEASQQEVLSEDLGDGTGLEIYALFMANIYEEIEYVERQGGSGVGTLAVGLIIQASTGAVIYEDPVSASYKPRVTSVSSHGNHAIAWFNSWPQTRIVSWSDRDLSKRRWTTEMQVADYYSTYDVLPDEQGGGITNPVDYDVEHSVQTVLMEAGGVKFFITPPTPYLGPSPEQGDDPIRVFWPASLAASLSSEKYLWIDEPDGFVPFDGIVHRTEYLMSPLTGSKTRVSEWFPGNPGGGRPDNGVPLNMSSLTMLNSGFLYAYDESPASPDERDRFVEFLGGDGEVKADFATLIPLTEDPDLVGKGRVVTSNYPAGFQAVLDGIANGTAQVAWHVVPDPDLVPARRR